MTTPPQVPIRAPVSLDLKNIQGDILRGFSKKTEFYFFFDVTDARKFRVDLNKFIPLIRTAEGVEKDRSAIDEHKRNKRSGLVPLVGVNIAFSHKGFAKLGVDDATLGGAEDPFKIGQKLDATTNLGDPKRADGNPDWDNHFLQEIHGIILISGECHETIRSKKHEIEEIFGVRSLHPSINEIVTLQGDVRPGNQCKHEHFGFLDGISEPVIKGFDTEIHPGPKPVDPGVIVTGHTGDITPRADWAKDGSFLVFCYLFQQVPEFNDFLKKYAIQKDGNGKVLTPEEGSALLGARMVGRWKSGAPVDITPFEDDGDLGKDPMRNNDFAYTGQISSQFRCPFAAHIRKTNPQDDLEVPPSGTDPIPVQENRIMCRGIQFGPEVNPEEALAAKTHQGRGLLFACYQTSIVKGFQFHQQSWANNAQFPPFTGGSAAVPGFVSSSVRMVERGEGTLKTLKGKNANT